MPQNVGSYLIRSFFPHNMAFDFLIQRFLMKFNRQLSPTDYDIRKTLLVLGDSKVNLKCYLMKI